MDRFNHSVRASRNDGKSSLPLARFRLPRLVESGEQEQSTVGGMDPERLAVVLRPAPLVETVGGNNASTLQKRVFEGRSCLNRFRLRVDTPSGRLIVFCPAVHETPAGRVGQLVEK